MKTPCSALPLLLLLLCCCDGIRVIVGPISCCVNFSVSDGPLTRVQKITKTHSTCLRKGFIVETVLGRKLCYKQTFPLALEVYNQHHNARSAGQQP